MRIKIDSILRQKYSNRRQSELPSEIYLNREVSWMIGIWIGDNWSSKEGSVIKRGIKSSGKFGINNNDKENIIRFRRGLRDEFDIKNIRLDVQIPRCEELKKELNKRRASKSFGIPKDKINVYFGSPWRKNIGYAVYTNNTVLLRIVTNEIYKKLPQYIEKSAFNIGNMMQGIVDSEGTVDKANKVISITNKDDFVIKLITKILDKLEINFTTRFDRDRTRIDINTIQKFKDKIGLNTERKQRELSEMLSGNYARKKDVQYLGMFRNMLRKGATAKEVSEIFQIPHPTVKLVLRNLYSGNYINRKKISRYYVYYFPRACRTKREVSPKKRQLSPDLLGD